MTAAPGLQLVRVDQITPHPENPRRSLGDLEGLAASIKAVGVLQALVLHDNEDGTVTCLLGHRRHGASALAGLEFVPAQVWTGLSQAEQLEIMLTENLQRQDLTPMEEARAFEGLLRSTKSQRVLADRLGCNQSHISRRIELLKLSPEDQERVDAGKLTVSKALKSLKPQPEKAPEPAPVAVPAALRPDPIDVMEPIGYKVIEIDGEGEYRDNWSADILASAEAARTDVATAEFHGEPIVLVPVALVPLPAITSETSATDESGEPSPSDEVGSVAGGEEEGLAVPASERSDAGPLATAIDEGLAAGIAGADGAVAEAVAPPEELTEDRKRALVHFAKTWGEIKAADEETVRESAEHEFFDSPGDAERAVKLWQTARELHKVAS